MSNLRVGDRVYEGEAARRLEDAVREVVPGARADEILQDNELDSVELKSLVDAGRDQRLSHRTGPLAAIVQAMRRLPAEQDFRLRTRASVDREGASTVDAATLAAITGTLSDRPGIRSMSSESVARIQNPYVRWATDLAVVAREDIDTNAYRGLIARLDGDRDGRTSEIQSNVVLTELLAELDEAILPDGSVDLSRGREAIATTLLLATAAATLPITTLSIGDPDRDYEIFEADAVSFERLQTLSVTQSEVVMRQLVEVIRLHLDPMTYSGSNTAVRGGFDTMTQLLRESWPQTRPGFATDLAYSILSSDSAFSTRDNDRALAAVEMLVGTTGSFAHSFQTDDEARLPSRPDVTAIRELARSYAASGRHRDLQGLEGLVYGLAEYSSDWGARLRADAPESTRVAVDGVGSYGVLLDGLRDDILFGDAPVSFGALPAAWGLLQAEPSFDDLDRLSRGDAEGLAVARRILGTSDSTT
ncbi:MAG: hypothetical protein AAF658_17125, partial [Myxococcota bacterium]